MAPPVRDGRRFRGSLALYALLVSIFALPVLTGDCGAGGGDIAAQCGAARRDALLYLAIALLIPLAATALRRRGLRGSAPLLLTGWMAPLLAVMLAAWLGGEG
jgi:hypothetical protein